MKIGFIGCGKMGGSILNRIINKTFLPSDILVYELNNDIKNEIAKKGVKKRLFHPANIISGVKINISFFAFNSGKIF